MATTKVLNDPTVHYRTATGWLDATNGVFTPNLGFPNAATVGVAAIPGWTPTTTIETEAGFIDFVEAGAVVEDIRFVDTSVVIRAPNITFNRCEFVGQTTLNDYGGHIANGLVYNDCTWRYDPPGYGPGGVVLGAGAVQGAGYTLQRCAIIDAAEGIRTGGTLYDLLDPTHPLGYTVRIYNTYCQISGPQPCSAEQGVDYHGDAFQSVDTGLPGGGCPIRIRNSTLISHDQRTTTQPPESVVPECGATSCMILHRYHNGFMDVDGVVLSGAGISLDLQNTDGSFRNVYIRDDSWAYHPVESVDWSEVVEETWDVVTCTLDADLQPDVIMHRVPYGYNGETLPGP